MSTALPEDRLVQELVTSVAQLVEQRSPKPQVGGSIPSARVGMAPEVDR